jgi:hypothetical protein
MIGKMGNGYFLGTNMANRKLCVFYAKKEFDQKLLLKYLINRAWEQNGEPLQWSMR